MNSYGVTSVTDPGCGAESVALYNEVYNAGKATVRMNLLLMLANQREEDLEQALRICGMRTGFGNEWLRVAGYKLFADGIPPLKTAWMYTPYIGGGVGGLVLERKNDAEKEARLRALIRILHKNRYQIGIHGTGERTVDVIYDEYMKCMETDPWDARHYDIHCDFARPEILKKIGAFNKQSGYELSINVQSAIKWTIADHMPDIVGKERAGYMWPLRAMIDSGIKVTDSSDAPVTAPNFLFGIEAAVLRDSKATKTPIGPEQAITVKEAIANYTINGAWQTHEEKIKGSIEPGKLADFCVIDKDILTVEPHEISKAKVLTTIVGGQVVYSAEAGK
jgi:predicted amidohydrolase YtcJ